MRRTMGILYNKTATLYTYSRNTTTKVASYSTTGTLFACNIQPVNTKDGIEGSDFLKTRKMYSDVQVNVGDKINCDGITYIVERTEHRDGTRRRFFKSFIIQSNGN